MNSTIYRDALPHLQKKIQFQVEEVTALDLYYNDGDSRVLNSFFKLVFSRKNNSVSVVFIYEGGSYISHGYLTDEESLAIHDWIDERLLET